MKTKLYILSLLLISVAGFAQQNAQYSQYIFNQLVINPAYAGTKGTISVNGIYSAQWSGLDGAPTTQSISIEGPAYKNMGLGLHIIRDEIGAQSHHGIYGSYSYKIRLNSTYTLSMGVASGVSYYTLNGSYLTRESFDDPAIPLNTETATRFDSKIGLFFYSRQMFLGFSVSELTADVKKSYDLLVAGQVQHYYLTGGYVFKLNDDFKFKPGFLIKEDFKAPTNIDLNSYILYKNRFWLGGTFRTGADIFRNKEIDQSLRNRDAVIVMADFNINNNFRIGYAYTFTLSALKDFPGHEIALSYYFRPKTSARMLTPRYF